MSEIYENDMDSMKLSDLFDHGWKIQRELAKSGLCEQSSEFLAKRKNALDILKRCEFMLDELHLFSDNESLDEVSTSELRYFLTYALIGWLFNKVNSNKSDTRLAALLKAKSNYLKYLALTKDYDLHKFNVDKMSKEEDTETSLEKVTLNLDRQAEFDANLINMAHSRSEKIARYKDQKQIEKEMDDIAKILDSVKKEQVDEETRRKYFTKCLKFWINQALDDFKCINDEISILKSIELEKVNKSEQVSEMYANIDSGYSQPQAQKKPFIITKDALQAKVFGMGYPSLPVYSIEEFADQKINDGCMPTVAAEPGKGGAQIGGGVTDNQKDDDKANKDALEDAYDETQLQQARNWDEFKDENKRGAGNTYNRS